MATLPSGVSALNENQIRSHIVECAIEVHRNLGGPGLLERVYEHALVWELKQRGTLINRQVELPIVYKGHAISSPLRIDLIAGGKIVVECKAAATYNSIFEARILTRISHKTSAAAA